MRRIKVGDSVRYTVCEFDGYAGHWRVCWGPVLSVDGSKIVVEMIDGTPRAFHARDLLIETPHLRDAVQHSRRTFSAL